MKKPLVIAQLLFLAVFLACAGYLAKYFYDSHTAQEDIEELQQEVNEASDETPPESVGSEPTAARAENGMLQKYYRLYKQNEDFIGWVTIADTPIDYPVMCRQDDNEYYLHRNFEKEYQYSGLPFLDNQCDAFKPSANLIIYAHNMKDGTMFAPLTKYEDKSYYSAHNIIKFDTAYEEGIYEIIGVFSTTIGSANEFEYHKFINADSPDEFYGYVNKVKELSYYDTGISAIFGDQLLTLSTCSYGTSNERFVIVTKRKTE